MGNHTVSMKPLNELLSSSSKLFHGLVSSDLNPRDHQNFSSCWRISRDEISEALKSVGDSGATSIYLKLIRSIIDAYIEKSTTLIDRIFHSWKSVFISRLWFLWIDIMGKKRLDKLAIELTKNFDERPQLPAKEIQQYFLTLQAVYSIELNAHCLVYLVLLVLEGKLPEETLSIERFNSQSAEAIFRSARSFSSSCSSGVNFTVLQFLNNIDKLSLFQKIKSRQEQLSSPFLQFPIHHKIKSGISSSNPAPSNSLPTHEMIERIIYRAFETATEYFEQLGVMDYLRNKNVYNIDDVNDHIRTLFNRKKILDGFSLDTDNDDSSGEYIDSTDSIIGAATSGENSDEEENNSVLRFHDDPDSLQPTFRGMRICDNVPPHLLQSYFKVRINGRYKFIHKSSACWILTENRQKLSSDRTRRVTQTK